MLEAKCKYGSYPLKLRDDTEDDGILIGDYVGERPEHKGVSVSKYFYEINGKSVCFGEVVTIPGHRLNGIDLVCSSSVDLKVFLALVGRESRVYDELRNKIFERNNREFSKLVAEAVTS